MNNGISLIALAEQIEASRALKHDMIVPANRVRVESQSDGVVALDVPGQGTFPILPIAHGQLAEYADIPRRYYDRMRAHDPELLANNVNRWLQDKRNDKRMIRTLGGDTRAWLSNRYARVENEEIAEVVLPILQEIPGIRIVSTQLTDRRMYLQAVTEEGCRVVRGSRRVGDIVQRGVAISNSEVGLGSVQVAPLCFYLACLNGAIASDNRLRAYHVGRASEDTAALLADDTRAAEDKAILLKVRDYVKAALDQTSFDARIERMSALTEKRLEGDPSAAIEVLSKKVGATESEKTGILRSLIEGGDLSAWGFVNAVTVQAHAADYDRSVELEQAGGTLLELSAKEWREVLTAV